MTPHTLTANNGVFDTGTSGQATPSHVTVTRAGTDPYHRALHTLMTGTITVGG
jgi:hypothetical protein